MYCGGIYKNLITAISLLLIIGCGGINKGGELVWPLPPDEPKIRYVGTLSTSRDVEKESIGKTLKTAVLGGEVVEGVVKPYGVHKDKDGRVYVADTGWGKVLVFDFAAKKFVILGAEGSGVLSKPAGITTDSTGRIFVTDTIQNRVVVYDKDTNFYLELARKGI